MSLASSALGRDGAEGKPSHDGLASMQWAPWSKAGPLGEAQAAKWGPAGHKHNPPYSLGSSPSLLLTFLLQAC